MPFAVAAAAVAVALAGLTVAVHSAQPGDAMFGLTKVFFPEASNTVIFVIMAIVLLIRPAGLFGRTA